MIIKCPECKNVFLAPDDLEEDQELKCGKCDYAWSLNHKTADIPETIKPNETSHIDDFKATEQKEMPAIKTIFMSIVLFAIIAFGLIVSRNNIVAHWEPSAKIFSSVNMAVPVTGEGLVFEKITASEKNNNVILRGIVRNTTNKKMNVPVIHIADTFTAKAEKPILYPMNTTTFFAVLPRDIPSPIKVSF